MESSEGQVLKPAVMSFVGRSGSGKTVLLEKLIAAIVARGIKVGTLKHHGHKGFDIDVEGKDSWRHRQAGSSHVVVASPDKIASYRDLDHELDAKEIISEFTDVDLVLVEGYRTSEMPTFIVARAANPKQASDPSELDNPSVVGLVTDMPVMAEAAARRGLPVRGLDDTQGLADLVLELTGLAGRA